MESELRDLAGEAVERKLAAWVLYTARQESSVFRLKQESWVICVMDGSDEYDDWTKAVLRGVKAASSLPSPRS